MPRPTCRKFLFVTFVLAFLPFFAHAQTLININTAGVAELDTLPGIGPAYAERIVDYRTANGPFQKIEEIQNVSGIGPVTFAEIKDLITVGSADVASQSTSQTNQDSQSESAHYSVTPVTNAKKASPATVSAGRDRVGSVGNPLEFRAETADEASNRQHAFRWNFGDGSEGSGSPITHIYDYPGEYIVVLKANFQEGEAEARVNVKIVDPGIVATLATPERIELKNNSGYEAGLFGLALIVGGRAFVFPRDTIIKAGQSISFSSKVTKLSPFNTSDVQIIVLGETENPKILAKIEKQRVEKIARIENQIASLRQQIASYSPPRPHLAVLQPNEEPSAAEDIVSETGAATAEFMEAESQTASTRDGWLSILKRFFLGTQK